MKAIILPSGEEGALWPVSADTCIAGLPLLDRPLLAWTAQCLKRAGAEELILALPEGAPPPDPAAVGIPLTVRRVSRERGLGEALAACADALEEEALLAVPGDALWDMDLERALLLFRESGRPAARLLCRPPAPGQRVIRLREHSFGDTGGAVLTSAAAKYLAAGGGLERDVLPRLEREGLLAQVETAGVCIRLRRPRNLLTAAEEILSGELRRCFSEEPVRTGIWSASPIPPEVELVPPCRIGAGVILGKGCLIGPHAVLEDGVTVGDHSLVQRSILRAGASVGSRATVYGAVVGGEAALGHYAVLNEGSAVGPAARIGENAILMENVGVGPGLEVPPSVRLTRTLAAPMVKKLPHAAPEPELTVEDLVELGRRLGRCGAVGAGGAGFRGLLLARAFGCGAAAQGAAVVFHDAVRAEQAAWLARYYGWPASVFVDADGGAYLFDRTGGPLERPPADSPERVGSWDLLAGTGAAYEAARERERELPEACPAFHDRRGLEFL